MSQLDAGDFSAWLDEVQAAIDGHGITDVPCGTCVACCSSSQFVHIGPDESDARAHIPAALLFPAPRMPHGHLLMGYDEDGRCPMLSANGCSIYEHRPRTCRTYDCRVFPAAGLLPDEPDKSLIADRAAQWTFSYTGDGEALHAAVRAAAAYVAAHRDELPAEAAPATSTQLAVSAVELHQLLLDGADPPIDAVRIHLARRR